MKKAAQMNAQTKACRRPGTPRFSADDI
jgi:hypothetical protein